MLRSENTEAAHKEEWREQWPAAAAIGSGARAGPGAAARQQDGSGHTEGCPPRGEHQAQHLSSPSRALRAPHARRAVVFLT